MGGKTVVTKAVLRPPAMSPRRRQARRGALPGGRCTRAPDPGTATLRYDPPCFSFLKSGIELRYCPVATSTTYALQMSLATRTVLPLSVSLLAAALVLVARGEIEHALESYALFLSVPVGTTHADWFQDLGGRKLEAVATTLPPKVVAAARERGQARDPWATAFDLLTELNG